MSTKHPKFCPVRQKIRNFVRLLKYPTWQWPGSEGKGNCIELTDASAPSHRISKVACYRYRFYYWLGFLVGSFCPPGIKLFPGSRLVQKDWRLFPQLCGQICFRAEDLRKRWGAIAKAISEPRSKWWSRKVLGLGRGGGVIDPLIKKCPNGNKRTTSDAAHFVNEI